MLPPITPLAFCSAAYDVLIVGGGTAGLTLAARLSENPTVTVGVIEAGTAQFDNPEVYIPGLMGTPYNTPLDWNFTSIPQVELNGSIISYPRGRMLGGSSGINGMLWNRAGSEDYDAWGELGNPDWNWDSMLHYMMKTERFFPPTMPDQFHNLPNPPYLPQFHNTSGEVANSFYKWRAPVLDTVLPTAENLGIPQNVDPLSGSDLNAWVNIASIDPRNSTRSYSATAHLLPALGRANLAVLTGALATKLVLDDTKRATGVEFVVNGTTYTAKSEKEIIVSAGSLKSPQLLELSGIGNCTLLQSLNIDCLVDSPFVGEHLQDHPAAQIFYEFINGTFTIDLIKTNATLMAEALHEYYTEHKGPLSGDQSVSVMISLAEFLSDDEVAAIIELAEASNSTSPRIPILVNHLKNASVPVLEITAGPKLYGTLPGGQEPGRTYMTMIASISHTFSEGSVHINSTDPTAKPVIDPMFYTDPTGVDRAIMIAAVRWLDKFASTAPLSKHVDHRVAPPPSEKNLTDEQWWEHIQSNSADEWHPVGTTSMLPQEDGGVVDSRLRVYGVKGLRVVDAGVIPMEVAAHIQQTVYGVAEQAADIIKEDLASS